MARRHESLVPLSQDHYHGLLLVQQIRTNDRLIMTGWPADPGGRAAFVAAFFREHLVKHFTDEEQSLFPLVVEFLPTAKKQVEDLLNDHRLMEDFARKFGSPDPTLIDSQLHEFAGLLEQHIRKEERQLFPLFEQQAPQEVLDRVSRLLHRTGSGEARGSS